MPELSNISQMLSRLLLLSLMISGLVSCNYRHDAKNQILQEINQNWEFRQTGHHNWLPASVPGTVHTDLLANHLIEDPFYRMNEKQLQWIDKVDWEYRTVFFAGNTILNKDKTELIFEGLDTYARIYLNEDLLLQTDNMFRTWNIDVTGKIKKGENELRIVLESPTKKGLEELNAFGFQLAADNDQSEVGEMGKDRVSPYVRKAPYHFGWDWGPRLVTSGIWRPVLLRSWNKMRIRDVSIIIDRLTDEKAEMTAKIDIESLVSEKFEIRLFVDGILKFSRDSIPRDGVPRDGVPFIIDNPERWQPNGSGDQKLYAIQVELVINDEVVDTKTVKTGLRTVNLVQQPDEEGEGKSFYFEVNGQAVFAKGANYIPNDVFLNRVSPEEYEFIVKSAADANMNMLRVWGGGIYENDLFYDLCDQYGIMVWQDFMFACAMYPGHDAFLENVRREAIDNIKRLRNHPCIVLWCGNNEIEAAWAEYEENRGWGWKQRYDKEQREIIWKAYDTLFHHILPGVISIEDPGRSYWHSSPSAGLGQLASYESTSGDMHYWGVWHGLHPLTDFTKYKARFMSEYGFQSFPELSTVMKFAVPEDFTLESDVMMSHQRSGIGNLRIKQYMEQDYKVPGDFESFLYVSQLLQAEAISMAISSHRSDMPYCMGTLYWQLNDCWPAASWSGIDYYGRWKALHYFVREAFKPTILVCAEDEDFLKLKVVSDEIEIGKLKLEIRLVDFNGLLKWQSIQQIDNQNQVMEISLNEILGNNYPASVVLISELKSGNEIIDTDLHYFVKPKDLKLIDPGIKTEITEKADVMEVLLSSTNLAKNVFLYADGLEGQFSDNYFDLLPRERVIVTIPKSGNSTEALKSLEVLHLFLTERH